MGARALRGLIEQLAGLRFEEEVALLRDEQAFYWNYGPKSADRFLEVLRLPTHPLLRLLTERDCALLRTAVRGLNVRALRPLPSAPDTRWRVRLSLTRFSLNPIGIQRRHFCGNLVWSETCRSPMQQVQETISMLARPPHQMISPRARPAQDGPKNRLALRKERLTQAKQMIIVAEHQLELEERRERLAAARSLRAQLRLEWPRAKAARNVPQRQGKFKRPRR